MSSSASSSGTFPTQPYTPRHSSWPYQTSDFTRSDPSPDTQFYQPTRLVTHIDDTAISLLRSYYDANLPREGRILDICSSWVSHFPPELEARAIATATTSATGSLTGKTNCQVGSDSTSNLNAKTSSSSDHLEVIGMGMNSAELAANPILSQRIIQDLNTNPNLPSEAIGPAPLNAVTCVVSIDYLTQPLQVLKSAHTLLAPGSYVHLVISNRCFPTKVIRRWLYVYEQERLEMVGDYLHFAGFKSIEVVTLSEGRRSDPLWVVRGRKE